MHMNERLILEENLICTLTGQRNIGYNKYAKENMKE